VSRLAILIGGFLFIAAGIITLFSDRNWQGALFLFALGAALLVFFLKG
jgi:hypothetical protein